MHQLNSAYSYSWLYYLIIERHIITYSIQLLHIHFSLKTITISLLILYLYALLNFSIIYNWDKEIIYDLLIKLINSIILAGGTLIYL